MLWPRKVRIGTVIKNRDYVDTAGRYRLEEGRLSLFALAVGIGAIVEKSVHENLVACTGDNRS